jgi:putative peptidoglycan lipid II flippase
VVSWRLLSRRLGGLEGHWIAGSLIRMHGAGIPALIFAWATTFMVGVIVAGGPLYGLITTAIGGSGGLLLYVLFARAIGITEITDLGATVKARLGR